MDMMGKAQSYKTFLKYKAKFYLLVLGPLI